MIQIWYCGALVFLVRWNNFYFIYLFVSIKIGKILNSVGERGLGRSSNGEKFCCLCHGMEY